MWKGALMVMIAFLRRSPLAHCSGSGWASDIWSARVLYYVLDIVEYDYYTPTYSDYFSVRRSTFEFAPYYRYMMTSGDKCWVYGQFTVGFGTGTQILEEDDPFGETYTSESKLSTFRLGIAPGIMYRFADRWAVSAEWGLLGTDVVTETPEDEDLDETTTGSIHAGVDLGALTFALNRLF